MSPDEKIAKDACDYLFRVGKHANVRVEFDPVGYLRDRFAEAVKVEREACAKIAETYKQKADMRADMHKRERNQAARDAALDKLEAALEIETEIRARGA